MEGYFYIYLGNYVGRESRAKWIDGTTASTKHTADVRPSAKQQSETGPSAIEFS